MEKLRRRDFRSERRVANFRRGSDRAGDRRRRIGACRALRSLFANAPFDARPNSAGTQAAEEILQDIFFQLWNNAAKFDSARGSLPGWLLVSARNRAISRLRRRIPSEGEELEENAIALPFNLESDLAQQQLLGKVRGALETLPEGQRQAVELAYFEGMTHSEIAERTGEPLGTVKTRLRSAVETLKKKLQS